MKLSLFIGMFLMSTLFKTPSCYAGEEEKSTCPSSTAAAVPKKTMWNMRDKALYLGAYARRNGFDTGVCFIVNMNPASGDFRFFIFDLRGKRFIDSGLVAHGRCNEVFLKGRKYSNEIGCGCTSLGKYKIGEKYSGKWGESYRLYGLDESNSNVYTRSVVLHGHPRIPDKEVMYPLFQSDGCVTVSPGYFQKMSNRIDRTSRPILMEIYDSYELQ